MPGEESAQDMLNIYDTAGIVEEFAVSSQEGCMKQSSSRRNETWKVGRE